MTCASRVSMPCGPAMTSGRVRPVNCASSSRNGSPREMIAVKMRNQNQVDIFARDT
jgi:hypothetical protein